MTDQGADQDERARLERAAYARDASPADLQRLADFHAAREPARFDDVPPGAAEVEVEPSAPRDVGDAEAPVAANVPLHSRGRTLTLLAVGAILGAVVASAVTWGVRTGGDPAADDPAASVTPAPSATDQLTPETTPSLAVFDRPEEAPDEAATAQRVALSIGLVQPETRTVAVFVDVAFEEADPSAGSSEFGPEASDLSGLFVGRGESASGYLVCLFTEQPGAHACVSAADFARKGLSLRIHDVLWQWGPVGTVTATTLHEPAPVPVP